MGGNGNSSKRLGRSSSSLQRSKEPAKVLSDELKSGLGKLSAVECEEAGSGECGAELNAVTLDIFDSDNRQSRSKNGS